ncbi:E3 ubiquitin-protein ligase RING1-like [Cryptomeria japonica]|uniref:E3 ubiquitin-protein ligase RING1-like n=1 Tax=Cryptomeria japonica TaxID=3369 RepID=UPI0025AD95DE|nr:E3 ubiquitin-protein ligase RING1-like [Cryptomeria japonica]
MSGEGQGQGQDYWCYQCDSRVRARDDTADLLCRECDGGFIEEVLSPTPNFMGRLSFDSGEAIVEEAEEQHPDDDRDQIWPRLGGDHGNSINQIMESISSAFLDREEEGPRQSSRGRRRRGRAGMDMDAGGFNPLLHLHNLVGLRMGGGNVEIFVDNGSGSGTSSIAGGFGDYLVGPGLDHLIQQLSEHDPNRYGAPPASKTAVETMPTIKISETHLAPDSAHCAVCKDEFDMGSEAKQMPCNHIYHTDCIVPWLAQHNSCPVCRYEMPTDDPHYNQNRSGAHTSPWARNSDGGNSNFSLSGVPAAIRDRNHASVEPNTGFAAAAPSAPILRESSSTIFPRITSRSRRFQFSATGPSRAFISTTQQAEAEMGSGPTNSGETVSSRPNDVNSVRGSNVGSTRIDDDGDTVMSEARQDALD